MINLRVFEYERLKHIFIPPAPGMTTRKLDTGTELTEGCHDEICLVYVEGFADGSMSPDFAERTWGLFIKKAENWTEFLMVDKQDRLTGYQNGLIVAEGAHGH